MPGGEGFHGNLSISAEIHNPPKAAAGVLQGFGKWQQVFFRNADHAGNALHPHAVHPAGVVDQNSVVQTFRGILGEIQQIGEIKHGDILSAMGNAAHRAGGAIRRSRREIARGFDSRHSRHLQAINVVPQAAANDIHIRLLDGLTAL